jgi:RNA polymerase sigma-70 factor, ECF subfamily
MFRCACNGGLSADTSHASLPVQPLIANDELDLCRTFAPRIRLYGLKHLKSPAGADDLVQEVLIIVLEALRGGRIREPEHMASFVLGTCRNVVQNIRTTGARRRGLLERFPRDLVPAVDGDRHHVDHARLGMCMTRLPPREHQIILATFYGDSSADAIAADLSTSPGNVRVLRHRALGHLRQCMEAGP